MQLLFAESNTERLDAIYLGRRNRQMPPAAPDIQKLMARLQKQLVQNEHNLLLLRYLQRIVTRLVIGARVQQSRVEKQPIIVVTDVVVMSDLRLLPVATISGTPSRLGDFERKPILGDQFEERRQTVDQQPTFHVSFTDRQTGITRNPPDNAGI